MAVVAVTGCGDGVGGGRVCGAEPARLYTRGLRCDAHAPWATARGGDGVPPELHGQYCVIPLHKHQTPDVASWGAVDARAIASGKRRASPQQQAVARAVVAEQAERRAAADGRR